MGKFITEMGMQVVYLTGSKQFNSKFNQGRDPLAEFNGNASVTILLSTIKTGGLGINLTVANHVFIADPWWNPVVED